MGGDKSVLKYEVTSVGVCLGTETRNTGKEKEVALGARLCVTSKR